MLVGKMTDTRTLHAAAMAAKSFAECALFALDYPDSVTARETLPACQRKLEEALASLRPR